MHDPRFKKLLQEFFAEFFRLFFPEWAERFNFNSVVWLDKEILSDALQGESRVLDVVAKLATLEPVPSPDRRSPDSWVALIHVEIEAADTVAPLRQRMFHYYEPLRRRHGLPVLPIGLYLRVGLEGIGWEVYEERFWDHELVRFSYAYVGLPALDAEQYVRQDNWLGVALAALMKVTRERRIELAGEALGRLVHCPENAYRKSLLCECVSAYVPLDEDQRRQYEEMLRNHPDSGVQAMQTGFLDHIEQRGIQLGMQQGKLEGQRELLRQQLEKRFGPLTPSALSSLEAWPSDQLAKLGCDLLTATSLEQLGLGS
jgi:predicted transposase YdaD